MVKNELTAIVIVFIAGLIVLLVQLNVLEYNTPKSSRLMKACDRMCSSKVDVFEYDIEANEIKECRCLR